MGKDFSQKYPKAKEIFDRADTILGIPLSQICFEGPDERLTRTLFAQPALFVTSLAILAALHEKYPDLNPSWVAGLSLGEFTALVACGALSFEDGLRVVQTRAQAMEECS
ncbi:MAG: ACP S-malonyltransferase, partial [Candidatus Omnitrophica bacterium]|nr:ACP S-malonyltransferase [Candidatus Omnitrophota bacterium]